MVGQMNIWTTGKLEEAFWKKALWPSLGFLAETILTIKMLRVCQSCCLVSIKFSTIKQRGKKLFVKITATISEQDDRFEHG